jgi:acyl carrier protein
MNIDNFIDKFRAIFEEGKNLEITPSTEFRNLEQWDSLAVLGFMSMIDTEFDAQIATAELKDADTIQDLFQLVKTKKSGLEGR